MRQEDRVISLISEASGILIRVDARLKLRSCVH